MSEVRFVLQFMHEKGLYESPEEFQQRVDVLQLLLELVPDWVKTVARHLGKPEAEVADADGSVLTYGSFRLSTHGPGATSGGCYIGNDRADGSMLGVMTTSSQPLMQVMTLILYAMVPNGAHVTSTSLARSHIVLKRYSGSIML